MSNRTWTEPGQLADVGGYKLHINCTGSGTPAVVLEAGLGEAVPYDRRELRDHLPHLQPPHWPAAGGSFS